MFVTDRPYCNFEVFLGKESLTIRTMKDLNYENVVPKLSYFYDDIIVPEFFTKKILKLKGPVKSY